MGTGRSCMVSFTMMIQVETKGESKLLPHPHVSGTVANVRHNQEWAGDWLGCGLCLGVPPVPLPCPFLSPRFFILYSGAADQGEPPTS